MGYYIGSLRSPVRGTDWSGLPDLSPSVARYIQVIYYIGSLRSPVEPIGRLKPTFHRVQRGDDTERKFPKLFRKFILI